MYIHWTSPHHYTCISLKQQRFRLVWWDKCELHMLCAQFDLEPHGWTCSLLLLRVLRDVIGSRGEAGHSRSMTCYSMTTLIQPATNAYTSERGCSCKVEIYSLFYLCSKVSVYFPLFWPIPLALHLHLLLLLCCNRCLRFPLVLPKGGEEYHAFSIDTQAYTAASLESLNICGTIF